MRRHDMLIYDERERYPYTLYALALMLASPFIYLAITRVILIYLAQKGQCVFINLQSDCPLMPEATPVFNVLSLLHTVYARIALVKPELRYLQMLMYVAGVVVAFLPFMFRNYRAGKREIFMLVFLASGALCTLLVR